MLKSIRFAPVQNADTIGTVILSQNNGFKYSRTVTIPADTKPTGPYWLQESWQNGMYTVNDQTLRGLPLTPRSCKAYFDLNIDGTNYTIQKDIVYKWVNPAKESCTDLLKSLPLLLSIWTTRSTCSQMNFPKSRCPSQIRYRKSYWLSQTRTAGRLAM